MTFILEPTINTYHLRRFLLNSASIRLAMLLCHLTRESARLLLQTLNVAILLVIVEVVGKAILLGLSKGFDCGLCLRLCDVHARFIFIIDFSCIIIIFNEVATRCDNWLFFDWLTVLELLFLRRCRLASSIATAKERTCCTHRLFIFLNLLALDGKVRIVIVTVIGDHLLLNCWLLFRVIRIVLIEVTLSLHIIHKSR